MSLGRETALRYRFFVSYDGTAYHGWQRQAKDASVQQALERAFATAARQPCAVVGAGRTDAGVHARRLGAHADLCGPQDVTRLERAVNGLLPADIAITELAVAPEGFHARFSAIRRQYLYRVIRHKDPLLHGRVWRITWPVDWELVAENLAQLIGQHDCCAFQAAGSAVESSVCRIYCAELQVRDGQWVFCLAANRFLYRMVRSIVGSAVAIGRGALRDSLGAICDSRDRRRAGPSAPACGLLLDEVTYPEEKP